MEKKIRPIKPEEIILKKQKNFPDEVITSFNELIAQKWNGKWATISQEEVMVLMVEKGLERNEIFDKGWLDIEDIYRSAGWNVEYDKPGYNESYPATFTFRKQK